MEQKQKPVYSVVISAYNEESREKKMRAHLKSIDEYFANLGQLHEVVIYLDGPTDKTPELVAKHSADLKNIRIIDGGENKGKGFGVRSGLMAAEGQVRLFTDMDGATPINMLDRMIPKFQEGADIVIGSRDLDDSQVKVHQPFWKEWLGNAGNILIQATLGMWGVKDTQCGFKAFTEKSIKDIIPRCTVNRWGLDFEILGIGKKLGYRFEQVPVEWVDAGDSLVGISGYISTLRDLFRVKWNMIIGKYQLRKKVEQIDNRKI